MIKFKKTTDLLYKCWVILIVAISVPVRPNCPHQGILNVAGAIDDDAVVDRFSSRVANDFATLLLNNGDVHLRAVGCIWFEFEALIRRNLNETILLTFVILVFARGDLITADAHFEVFILVLDVSGNFG